MNVTFEELIEVQKERDSYEWRICQTDFREEVSFILELAEEIEPIGQENKKALLDISQIHLHPNLLHKIGFEPAIKDFNKWRSQYANTLDTREKYENKVWSILQTLDISKEINEAIRKSALEVFYIANWETNKYIKILNMKADEFPYKVLNPIPNWYTKDLHRWIKHNFNNAMVYIRYPYGFKHTTKDFQKYIKDKHNNQYPQY